MGVIVVDEDEPLEGAMVGDEVWRIAGYGKCYCGWRESLYRELE